MNYVWTMLNGLQLAAHLPLYRSLFPANANYFVSYLVDVATFDLLPSQMIQGIFDVPNKQSFNLAF